MAQIIDGKAISSLIKDELKLETAQLTGCGVKPALAVIQVGSDPASSVYVRNKKRACEYVGIKSLSYELGETVTEEELLSLIKRLNEDGEVTGILVQLPLPAGIDENAVINAVSPLKDVDGFHPVNVGNLSLGKAVYLPCTPAGVICLLKRSGITIEGKECVVIGRSNIVGKPMAQLLLKENGTVTVAHSRTVNLKEVARRADILVVAAGKRGLITGDYVKEGAAVIDVGIHRGEDGRLSGDVDFESAAKKAGYITPVPGGVGPMTIAMLMKNCVEGAKMQAGITGGR